MRQMGTNHFFVLLLLNGFLGIALPFDPVDPVGVESPADSPSPRNIVSPARDPVDFMEGLHKWYNTPPAQLTVAQVAYFNSIGKYDTHRSNGSDSTYAKRKRTFYHYPMKYRKEIRQMKPDERTKFFNAINAMKTTMIDGMSEYDIFVAFHNGQTAKAAHNGAAFLPWHREYLWRFERALQAKDPSVALPYWDTSLDYLIPNPRDSVLWSKELLGNNDGIVTTGPFKNWQTMNKAGCNGPLTRNAQGPSRAKSLLFNDDKYIAISKKTTFAQISTQIDGLTNPAPSFRGSQFEYDHGGVHVFVGGHMNSILCAPSDPVFWMHHAMIDFIWMAFRRYQVNKEIEYPSLHDFRDIGGPDHEAFAPMAPFDGLVNIHGLSNHERSVICEYSYRDCGQYAWCDKPPGNSHGRCKAKIKPGGDCTGFSGWDPCYGSGYLCRNNKCVHWWRG